MKAVEYTDIGIGMKVNKEHVAEHTGVVLKVEDKTGWFYLTVDGLKKQLMVHNNGFRESPMAVGEVWHFFYDPTDFGVWRREKMEAKKP